MKKNEYPPPKRKSESCPSDISQEIKSYTFKKTFAKIDIISDLSKVFENKNVNFNIKIGNYEKNSYRQ